MAIMRKDEYSGGIVFDLTPEEKAFEDKVKNIDKLTKKLEKKLSEVESLLASQKKSEE